MKWRQLAALAALLVLVLTLSLPWASAADTVLLDAECVTNDGQTPAQFGAGEDGQILMASAQGGGGGQEPAVGVPYGDGQSQADTDGGADGQPPADADSQDDSQEPGGAEDEEKEPSFFDKINEVAKQIESGSNEKIDLIISVAVFIPVVGYALWRREKRRKQDQHNNNAQR